MKKIFQFLPVISFCFLSGTLFGQKNHVVDSLENVLKTAVEDTGRVNALFVLSKHFRQSGEYEKAMELANDALAIAGHIDFKKGKANICILIGALYYEQGNYSSALKNYFMALEGYNEIKDKKGVANSYNNIGIILFEQGNYPEAIKSHIAALKLREEIGDKKGIAGSYNNIGVIYEKQANYPEALKYHLGCLTISKEMGNKGDMADSYNNLGIINGNQGNYDEALKNYFACLNLKMEIHDKKGMALAYDNIGAIYEKLGNYSEAMKNHLASLEIGKEIGDEKSITFSYIDLGIVSTSLKKFSDAGRYLHNALQRSMEIGSREMIWMSYLGLSELESARGKYQKAFEYYKMYTQYKDSLVNEESNDKIAHIKAQYETEKKDKQIELLNKDKQLQFAEISRQKLIRNTMLGGGGIAGIFSFVLLFSFNRRRKASFEKQVSEVEMKALRSQMNPHFIFNSLNSVKKYVLENATGDAAEYLSKFSTLMRLILENSRKQEVTLEKDLSALELYMELESLRFQNKFKYEIEVDNQIDREDTMIAPLLLQPFVENSIIHGISSKENGMIKIKVSKADKMIKCIVEDNGIGREQSVRVEDGEKKKRESLGMKITQERLNIINQLKKVKTAVNIFDIKDEENKPGGLRIELLLPFETAF